VVTLIGFAAGVLTTGSLIPQVLKTHRTQSVSDFSLLYLTAMDAGLCLWIAYGMFVGSTPIVASNVIAAMLISYLACAKVRHKRAARSHAVNKSVTTRTP
jgi:MtN3 and saliva related transmembrane protein